ncbi:MAG: (Fe-S)-binding protein [Desulfobacterales bacterium]|jgi:L-lactate dehydrogenase complex protein LldE
MPPMRTYPKRPEAIYVFGTCLIESMYPHAGLAAIRLLQREGLRVVFPRGQTCCGQPAYNAGYSEEARQVARQQLRAFPQDYPIVVPSGSCAGMMRHHYPYLFAGHPEWQQTRAFAERIFELTEFMHRVLGVQLDDQGPPVRVTWHSSCHAKREMQVTEDSKTLLRKLQQVELVELEREDECCGFGGTFAVKQPAVSAAMVYDKTEDIRKRGVERVISGDCGCLMNITGALAHRRLSIKGQHIAEFIWERTHA